MRLTGESPTFIGEPTQRRVEAFAKRIGFFANESVSPRRIRRLQTKWPDSPKRVYDSPKNGIDPFTKLCAPRTNLVDFPKNAVASIASIDDSLQSILY